MSVMTDQTTDRRGREQPDLVVAWLAYLLGELQHYVSWTAYTRLARRWRRAGKAPLYFNYAYAASLPSGPGRMETCSWSRSRRGRLRTVALASGVATEVLADELSGSDLQTLTALNYSQREST
jgi:hypothetical protein